MKLKAGNQYRKKINENRNWFFQKINKINKLPVRPPEDERDEKNYNYQK